MKLLSILILTVGLLFGTIYSVHAESLTKEQVDKLADLIVEKIYHTDYKTKFEWIALDDIKRNPQILNAAVLKKLKEKCKIFNSINDIPKEFNPSRGEYERGFIFKYKITFDSPDTVTVYCETYINGLNAGGKEVQYKWNGKEWEFTFKMPKMWDA